MSVPVKVLFADELAAKIDEARGDVPRQVWITRACEAKLGITPAPRSSTVSPKLRDGGVNPRPKGKKK